MPKKQRVSALSLFPETTRAVARRASIPPSVEDVAAYCAERGNQVDPEQFVDFYTSKGWMVGRNKMVDWQACVRTWEKSNGSKRNGTASHDPTGNLTRASDYLARLEGNATT